MQIKCPHCEKPFEVEVAAKLLKEQSIWFSIKYKGDLLQAKTIWSTIQNFEKLMQYGAKDLGSKATTYIRSIINKNHELKVEFVVMTDVPQFPKKLIEGLNQIIESK